MAPLPKQIVIGRWVWSVSDDAKTWAELGIMGTVSATTYGATHHHTSRIVMNPAQSARQKADTLLHEVLHCVWDQHQKISGYRDLTQAEIDAMNSIKAAETDLGQLWQQITADVNVDKRWASIAKTHFEEGFSALVRSVACPDPRF
jgi:hypothetical protein